MTRFTEESDNLDDSDTQQAAVYKQKPGCVHKLKAVYSNRCYLAFTVIITLLYYFSGLTAIVLTGDDLNGLSITRVARLYRIV